MRFRESQTVRGIYLKIGKDVDFEVLIESQRAGRLHIRATQSMKLYTEFISSAEPEPQEVEDLREYILWQWGHTDQCMPSDDDSIHVTTYLLEMRLRGRSNEDLTAILAAITQFYSFAQEIGVIDIPLAVNLPSEPRDFNREMVRRRGEIFRGTPEENEIARLRALNKLVARINRATELKEVLNVALETLVDILRLRCGWIFLLPIDGSPFHSPYEFPMHDFALGAGIGLPPGLEVNRRYYLCNPVDCHCQQVFRAGKLQRAVNVVQCTRLIDAAQANGDNEGLLFHASVPIHAGDQPAGIINVATEDWQFLTANDLQILSLIGAQVSEALTRARLFTLAESHRARMERELQLAREVQASLIPKLPSELPGFSLAADWRAAREMAGDFYDFIDFGDGRCGIVVADVSDKGAPAALFMAMTRSLIRSLSGQDPDPAGILSATNLRIQSYSTTTMMFVTVFYGILDVGTKKLVYASAGQDPPLLRAMDGTIRRLMPTGPLIGLFMDRDYENKEVQLQPGDTLVAYTDGLIDSMDSEDQRYSSERLLASLEAAPGGPALNVMHHLLADLHTFTSGAPPFDDLTCIVLVCDPED